MSELLQHAGDCTIYRAMINGAAFDGICTCGFGWQQVRSSDMSQMFSAERLNTRAESDRIRELELERDRLLGFIERAGYRRCDIPACNCGSFHGGHWKDRHDEKKQLAIALSDALEHVQSCEHCNADLWDRCPNGGVEAHATMKRAQKELEGK